MTNSRIKDSFCCPTGVFNIPCGRRVDNAGLRAVYAQMISDEEIMHRFECLSLGGGILFRCPCDVFHSARFFAVTLPPLGASRKCVSHMYGVSKCVTVTFIEDDFE